MYDKLDTYQEEELSKDLIEKLNAEEVKHKTEIDHIGICEICTDAIQPEDSVMFDKCAHLYHPSCVKPYLNKRVTIKY